MNNRKILYLMHVPWKWIKQRPHYLAEFLSHDFDVSVAYKKPLTVSSKHLKANHTNICNISSYLMLPYQRLPVIKHLGFIFKPINSFLFRRQVQITTQNIVWLTSLSIYSLIEKQINENTIVIFDCMDDELEFPEVKSNKPFFDELKRNERQLLDRANLIFCSSLYLKKVIMSRTNSKREDLIVVNNAVSLPSTFPLNDKYDEIATLENIIMYVGAISSWFDFEIILHAIEENPKANFVLIGPTDVEIPKHERIIHLGTVQREYIFSLMERADFLIMPFVINELIRSVNPVKLYEYIFMKKIIIVPYYEETEKFKEHVYFYKDRVEFSELIEKGLSGKLTYPSSDIDNKQFIHENTWENRYSHIKEAISRIS